MDEAKAAYVCPDDGDDRHHWISRRARSVDAWVLTCSICGAQDVEFDGLQPGTMGYEMTRLRREVNKFGGGVGARLRRRLDKLQRRLDRKRDEALADWINPATGHSADCGCTSCYLSQNR